MVIFWLRCGAGKSTRKVCSNIYYPCLYIIYKACILCWKNKSFLESQVACFSIETLSLQLVKYPTKDIIIIPPSPKYIPTKYNIIITASQMILIMATGSWQPVVISEPFLNNFLSKNLFSLKHLARQAMELVNREGSFSSLSWQQRMEDEALMKGVWQIWQEQYIDH